MKFEENEGGSLFAPQEKDRLKTTDWLKKDSCRIDELAVLSSVWQKEKGSKVQLTWLPTTEVVVGCPYLVATIWNDGHQSLLLHLLMSLLPTGANLSVRRVVALHRLIIVDCLLRRDLTFQIFSRVCLCLSDCVDIFLVHLYLRSKLADEMPHFGYSKNLQKVF